MAKRNKKQEKGAPYMLIICITESGSYDKPDRIMKNATLEEAKKKANMIWKVCGNALYLRIVNENNQELFKHEKNGNISRENTERNISY